MSGFFAVCFDVRDPKRLRRVADEMENFGKRVQRSLFECHLNDAEFNEFKNRIAAWIDGKEDQVRYYPLCPKDIPSIIIDGTGEKTMDSDYYMA
jgi:CRISPR-associated protein Cas2